MAAVPYRGVHEVHSIAETAARFPGVNVTGPLFVGKVSLSQSLWTKINNLCAPVWAAGETPAVTFKLNPNEVLAGQWDAQLAQVFANLDALGQPALIYYWHEPEDDMTGPTYVAAFNRVYSFIHDTAGFVSNPNPQLPPTYHDQRWLVGYAAMGYAWRPSGTLNPADWQGTTADFYSCHAYSGNSFPATAILPEHSGFNRWFNSLLLPTGKPFYVTERGFQAPDSATRVATINREADWLVRSDVNVAGYLYWNTAGAEGDPDWVLDAPGEDAVRNLIGRLAAKS